MRQIFKMLFALCLSVIVLSSCKKSQIEDATVEGSSKNGGKTSARNIYVSALIGNDANVTNARYLNSATPLRTLQAASDVTIPGDIVYIMNGTYEPPKNADGTLTTDPNHVTLNITRSGSATGGYITYKPYSGHTPKLYTYGRKWGTIRIDASYIRIESLVLEGANNNDRYGMLQAAKDAQVSWRAGEGQWTRYSEFNTSGIGIGYFNGPASHHINVTGCKVFNFSGGGIAVSGGDFLTIEWNTSYNNCWFTMYGGSGISIHKPTNTPGTATYKIKVSKNTCYNNFTQVPYYRGNGIDLSDGNGIIVDVNNGKADGHLEAYTGRTLIENNLVYKNGGSGIHTYQADHVDVFNNTTYENEQNLPKGNLGAHTSQDVRFRNNIAFAKSGGIAFGRSNTTNVTADYNLYYNGTVASDGTTTSTHNKNVNPLFVDRLNNNFSLQTSPTASPAINAGDPTVYPGRGGSDITWSTRIKNNRIDMGAYEVN